MKKLTLATLTILTLILTACGASSNRSQAAPANQARTLPLATQLIVGTFKLDGTPQAVTAEQAKELLPLWQVYKDLLSSDTAAQEEINGLVDQVQETMTKEQVQAITAMNLTQRDVFTLMQEKGLGGGSGQRNNSNSGTATSNGTSTSNRNNSSSNGGFVPPDGGFPGGGFPGGGGFTQRNQNQSQSSTRNNTTTTTQPRFNSATLLLDPLITLLKQKAGS